MAITSRQKFVLGLMGGVAAVVTAIAGLTPLIVALRTPDQVAVHSPERGVVPSPTFASTPSRLVTPTPALPTPSPTPEAMPWSGTARDQALIVSWDIDEFGSDAGASFAFPPGTQAAFGWPTGESDDPFYFARHHGGIPAGHQSVRLDIRSAQGDTVIIHRFSPVIVEARSFPTVAYAVKIPEGCGVAPVREALFDFDKTPPKTRYRTGEESAGLMTRRTMTLHVAKDDPETVLATANAERAYMLWALDIHYELNGVQGTLRVDRAGKPFEVTGVPANTPVMWLDYGSAVLRPADDPQEDPYGGYC